MCVKYFFILDAPRTVIPVLSVLSELYILSKSVNTYNLLVITLLILKKENI